MHIYIYIYIHTYIHIIYISLSLSLSLSPFFPMKLWVLLFRYFHHLWTGNWHLQSVQSRIQSFPPLTIVISWFVNPWLLVVVSTINHRFHRFHQVFSPPLDLSSQVTRYRALLLAHKVWRFHRWPFPRRPRGCPRDSQDACPAGWCFHGSLQQPQGKHENIWSRICRKYQISC